MPVQSREVVTLRLILACDCEEDLTTSPLQKLPPVGLLDLPVELRLEILRYVLLFDRLRESYTRRITDESVGQLFKLDSRKILDAPHFRHRSRQEIDGILPTTHQIRVNISPLLICKTLFRDGQSILYNENRFVALHTNLRGLKGRLKNYGIPVFGPIDADRLAPVKVVARSGHARELPQTSLQHGSRAACIKPVLVFRGTKAGRKAPFLLCTLFDLYDLVHALWIMVKSPFARNMRFTISVAAKSRPRPRLLDAILLGSAIPWLRMCLDGITLEDDTVELRDRHAKLNAALVAQADQDQRVLEYTEICKVLGSCLFAADKYAAKQSYLQAEILYERVCYQACGVVRTRTAQLVYVSAQMKDGINSICKLIAISAFRLCELRSGAILVFPQLKRASAGKSTEGLDPDSRASSVSSDDSVGHEDGRKAASATSLVEAIKPIEWLQTFHDPSKTLKTTQLNELEATAHAILSGLLAQRLPCATSLAEWNIRMSELLLYLFDRRNDGKNALVCVERMRHNYFALLREARAKQKTTRAQILEAVLEEIDGVISIDGRQLWGEHSISEKLHSILAHSHEVVRKLWGERLSPKPGHTSLIWTFRWA